MMLNEAEIDARMLRYPDVSKSHIAFVYAGDIWTVPKAGGTAQRLSTPAGEESFPRFSPDGAKIAFTGNYDGNTDVYAVPTLGGEPRRLTHHPGTDRLVDWYPDGESLLFASQRESGSRAFNQFYRVAAGGGANIFRGHDNVQGATDLGVLSHTLPGYYGLKPGSWAHWGRVWGEDMDWLKGQFATDGDKSLMNLTGIPVSRWIDGVLEDPANMDNPDNVRAMVLWGHAPNSQTRGAEMKTAMEKLDMLVVYPDIAPRTEGSLKATLLGSDSTLEIRSVEPVFKGPSAVLLKDEVVPGEKLIISNIATPVAGMKVRPEGQKGGPGMKGAKSKKGASGSAPATDAADQNNSDGQKETKDHARQ